MGQRLVIVNSINEEQVNTLYYHWSAYTDAALSVIGMLRDSVVSEYNKLPKDMDTTVRFNVASMRSASGVSSGHTTSKDYISKYLTKNELADALRGNRNEGLIAFTEDDMDDLLGWSEGTVYIEWMIDAEGNIDLEHTTFDIMQLLFTYEKENWLEYFGDDAASAWAKMEKEPRSAGDLTAIAIENAESYIDELPNEWYDPDSLCGPRIFQKIA